MSTNVDSKTLIKKKKFKIPEGLGAVVPLAVLIILLAIFTDTFLTADNLVGVLRQAAVYAIMAVGMTFVIITGGIDLTQGSLLAFCCVTAGYTINGTNNIVLGIIIAVISGTAVGLLNGIVIAYVKIPPFIMTLGGLYAYRGLTLMLTKSTQISVPNEAFRVIGTGYFLGIPIPVYIFIVVGIIAHIFLTRTATGRYIFAIGSNVDTARLSGVRVEKTYIIAYMLSGFCIGIASVVYLARLGAAQPTAGQSYEMEAVAATVIGGTSIAGGEGGIIGTLIGAVIIAIIRNGLVLIGVGSYWTQIVVGLIIIGAVSLDVTRRRLAK